MASLVTVRIDKGNSPNLGFRLQGGKDFGTPLVIQKLPPKKEVEIKKNIATTLRDASRLLKEQEEEVNRIQNILKGGCCSQQIEVALVEDRKNNERAAWEYIQRKHLEGLITFEEAILAKKKLLEDNKAKFLEVQAEKMYLNQILDEFKEREQKRVKAKVNGGSPAERAGLVAGDSVIKINNVDVFNLRHKDAQDVVVRAGHGFEMTIQRGGSTWKPSVIPTGSIYSPTTNVNNVSPVTRTSLSAKQSDNIGSIGTGHNLSAKPFNPQVNGAVNGGSKLVNKQYNTPLKLYSEESIAETLSAQTEVLSTGALGVNFKKNERNYDSSNSEVLRALKEAESDPNYHDQEPDSGVVTAPNSGIAGLRHVHAPETRPQPPTPQLPPGQNICADCERLIVGVFVRIKDKNLHVECFKCSTCGTSLKNVGYYNIGNKLYCDIHAKAAALKHQANPNLVPVTVPPGGKAPVHAISSALSSHSYPTSSPLSPKSNFGGTPYQAEESKENVNVDVASSLPILAKSNDIEPNTSNNTLYSSSTPLSFSKYLNKSSSFSGPKPFSNVSAPLSSHNTLPRAAPLSPVAPAQSFNHSYTPSAYSPSSGRAPSYNKPAGGVFRVQVAENIIWPPPQFEPEVPTACPLFYPPPSQIEQKIISKRKEKEEQHTEDEEDCLEIKEINGMSRFLPNPSWEFSSGRRSAEQVKGSLSETIDNQILVENIVKTRIPPPVPPIERDISIYQNLEQRPTIPDTEKSCPFSIPDDICCKRKNSCDLNKSSGQNSSNVAVSPNLPVPRKWESPLTQAIRTTSPDKDTFACIPTKHSSSAMATALSVAPLEPFKPASTNEEPVPLPEETEPYFPPERPVLAEKHINTPVPPIRKKYGPSDKLLEDLPKPEGKLCMLDALTTASERPYSPFIEPLPQEEKVEKNKKYNFYNPLKPDVLPASFDTHKKAAVPPGYYPPSVLYERTEESKSEEKLEESSMTHTKTVERQTVQNPEIQVILDQNQNQAAQQLAPLFHGFSCSFQNKGDISQFSVDVRTTPPIMSPPPVMPTVKSIEKPGYIQTEIITEAKSEKQQTKRKEEEKKTVQKKEQVTLKPAVKQAETVVPIKAVPQVSLHKPTQLPQYQVELSAEAESELILFEKKRQAELRIEQQRQENKVHASHITQHTPSYEKVKLPDIKVEVEDDRTFKPVSEERPPSHSFSPRPGSSTPSRIGNKPPPILPYYQANLVPQYMSATHSNVFDPKSPAVSRSPSPCPERSTSPGIKSNVRSVSPAPGPPENPLKSSKPLPNPESIRVDQARESLKGYLPDYKTQRDYIEEIQGMDFQNRASDENSQIYTSVVQTQNYPTYPIQEQTIALQRSDFLEAQRSEKSIAHQGDTYISTSREEQMKQAHLEQLKKSQSHSIEQSADGLKQIQRKRTVTEEYERTQKEVNIQIEKNVSSTRKYPFSGSVNAPSVEVSNVRGHMTDPQRMSSSFLKSGCSQIEGCLKQRMQTQPTASLAQPATLAQSAVSAQSAPAAFASNKHGSAISSVKSVIPPGTPKKPNVSSVSTQPDTGATSGRQSGGVKVAPRRGRGILNPAAIGGARIPLCGNCNSQVRGPFITALGKIWCPNHFICSTPSCRRPLQDIGFVEERGQLYCEYCFEQYLAPPCSKCSGKIKGDCLKAIGKNFHPECFNCTYCGKLFGNSPFFLEDGSPYCEADWNELFTTKCYACAFPIEAGDRWVEALSNNYHSQCFNCTMCKKNLEGQSFFAKGGRPFCKNHAR